LVDIGPYTIGKGKLIGSIIISIFGATITGGLFEYIPIYLVEDQDFIGEAEISGKEISLLISQLS
jgi:hypothetical protein